MSTAPTTRARRHYGRWLPIVAMIVLIIALGAYTHGKQPQFTSSFNLNGLLQGTIPLALAALAQASALMVKAFDVSVGALITVCMVVTSFVVTEGHGWWQLILGMLFVLGVALLVGTANVVMIRGLKLSSIIATLATYSILQGIALSLRPQPTGKISTKFIHVILAKVGFMPVAFIVIVAIAIAADIWLYRTPGRLAARAAGLDDEAAKRRGVRVNYLFVRAFFISAFAAGVGGLFLAAHLETGDPEAGFPLTLTGIAAAVLGGASLLGGRGSFIGAIVGALFLNLIINVLPFLGWTTPQGDIMVGVLTLVALSFYQAPELMKRVRTSIANFRLSRARAGTFAEKA